MTVVVLDPHVISGVVKTNLPTSFDANS